MQRATYAEGAVRLAALILAVAVVAAATRAGAETTTSGAAPATRAEPDTERSAVPAFESGRLLATSGVSQVEGAGGGGLSPWVLITGYGTADAVGANVHGTVIRVPDFTLYASGVAVGIDDRLELSYTHQWFDTGNTGRALGIGQGFTFHQDVLGAKLRLFGHAVYDQDTWMPQVSAGLQYKLEDHAALLHAIGARDAQGVDFYLAATKLFLAQSLLVNATLRLTRANQTGLLGFGGDRSNAYHPEFEGSAALLLSRHVAVGAEYRMKPDNLGFAHESNWLDVFVAGFLTKNVSATVACVGLGSIATRKDQNGAYLSLQVGF